MMADVHALRRTSPKGPGRKFVGTCMKCGIENLTLAEMHKPCVNPAGLSNEETFQLAMRENADGRS